MQGRLDLAAVGRVAASGLRVISAAQFDYVAVTIFDDIVSGNKIGVAQPHLAPGREAEEFL